MVRRIRLSNIIEIHRAENPGLDSDHLRGLFTYPNPKWIENERLGFSNFGVPREICLVQEHEERLTLPRGLVHHLYHARLEIIDRTGTNDQPLSASGIHLKPHQRGPVDMFLKKNQGLLVMPPGSGKTVVGIEIISRRRQKSLVIVHTKDLLEQWVDRFQSFAGVTPGIIDAGRFEIDKSVVIGMVQSLNRPLDNSLTEAFGTVLLDEAHHAPASSFQSVVSQFHARYRIGLTATPYRRDGLDFLLVAVMGPIQWEVERNQLFDADEIIKPRVRVIHTNLYIPSVESYHDLLRAVVEDEERNRLILHCVQEEARHGHPCLVLSERISHVRALHERFNTVSSVPSACLTGKDSKETRRQALRGMNAGRLGALFATRLADEGLDVKRLSRLFLTCPIRSTNKLTQQIGRIQRTFNGKHDAVVYDFYDDLVGLAKSQFGTRRHKVYEDYEVEDLFPYAR